MKSIENQTKTNCKYYNFGGDGTKERPTYPRSYGARCEFYKELFYIKDNILKPKCYGCGEFKRK